MAVFRESSEEKPSTGLMHPFRTMLATVSSALHTRLELFVTELEEERERLKLTLLFTFLAVFGLSLGFILATIFIVALLWESGWIIAVGVLAAVYLGIGIVAIVMLRNSYLARAGLFTATLAELAKDRDQMRTRRE